MSPAFTTWIRERIQVEHRRYVRGYWPLDGHATSPSEQDDAETSREIVLFLRAVLCGHDPKGAYEGASTRLRIQMEAAAKERHVTAQPSPEHGQDRLLAEYLAVIQRK